MRRTILRRDWLLLRDREPLSDETVAVSPGNGVLLAMRNADMSHTSSSLSLKFGMVEVDA